MLRDFLCSFVLGSLMFLFTCSQIALAGGGDGAPTDNNQTPTNPDTSSTQPQNSGALPTSSSASSLTNTVPTTPQRYDNSNSYNGYSNSNNPLNYPYCSSSCAFVITRLTPNSNGGHNVEGIIGFIHEFDSPNKQSAEAYREFYKAAHDRMIQEDQVSLLTQIAEAVNNCKDVDANLLALAAAKRLGISADDLLARAYKQRRNCTTTVNLSK